MTDATVTFIFCEPWPLFSVIFVGFKCTESYTCVHMYVIIAIYSLHRATPVNPLLLQDSLAVETLFYKARTCTNPLPRLGHAYLKSGCLDPTDQILHRNQFLKKRKSITWFLLHNLLNAFWCHGLDNFDTKHSWDSLSHQLLQFLTRLRCGWKGAYKLLGLLVVEQWKRDKSGLVALFFFLLPNNRPIYIARKKSEQQFFK